LKFHQINGMRIGFGFDVHQLSEQRELWLGGVKIPAQKGALGHSDADVLLHAICDAILGALALGDIGKHFPDTDQSIKGIDSKILLTKVVELIHAKGYRMPYAEQMRTCIASICNVSMDDVSVKATTNEKLGFIGREEGVTAYAVVLLLKS